MKFEHVVTKILNRRSRRVFFWPPDTSCILRQMQEYTLIETCLNHFKAFHHLCLLRDNIYNVFCFRFTCRCYFSFTLFKAYKISRTSITQNKHNLFTYSSNFLKRKCNRRGSLVPRTIDPKICQAK